MSETKRKNIVVICYVLAIIAATALSLLIVRWVWVDQTYEQAVVLYDEASYQEAEILFKRIESAHYLDTDAYISASEAHIYYQQGEIDRAYSCMKVTFSNLSAEQRMVMDTFVRTVTRRYEQERQEKAAQEQAAAARQAAAEEARKKAFQEARKKAAAELRKQQKEVDVSKDDPYDVYSYSDPDDFFYDYEDDFVDYEDAEDYFCAHQD